MSEEKENYDYKEHSLILTSALWEACQLLTPTQMNAITLKNEHINTLLKWYLNVFYGVAESEKWTTAFKEAVEGPEGR